MLENTDNVALLCIVYNKGCNVYIIWPINETGLPLKRNLPVI